MQLQRENSRLLFFMFIIQFIPVALPSFSALISIPYHKLNLIDAKTQELLLAIKS
jgi:hypothetical protein